MCKGPEHSSLSVSTFLPWRFFYPLRICWPVQLMTLWVPFQKASLGVLLLQASVSSSVNGDDYPHSLLVWKSGGGILSMYWDNRCYLNVKDCIIMTENPLCARHGPCFSEMPPHWIYSTAVGEPSCHFADGETKTLKSVRLIQGHPTWNQNPKYLFISKGHGSLRVFWPHKYQVSKIWEFPTPWVPGGQDRADSLVSWFVSLPSNCLPKEGVGG